MWLRAKSSISLIDNRLLFLGASLLLTWILGRFVFGFFLEPAAVYYVYYKGFSLVELVGHLTLTSVPKDWPALALKSHTYDFSVLYQISKGLDVINSKPAVMPENILPYGPAAFLFYHYLDKIFDSHIISLFVHQLLALSAFVFALTLALSSWCRPSQVLLTLVVIGLFTTIPHIFILSGNIESLVFSMTLIGVSIQPKKPKLAILFICLAASIKYYPAIFLLMFLKDNQPKQFVVSCMIILFTIIPVFFFLEGGFLNNLNFTLNEIQKSSRLCDDAPEIFCTYGGLSIANITYNLEVSPLSKLVIYRVVSIFILLVCLFNFFFCNAKSLSLLSLIIAFCLIPQVSVFYKLSYLLIFILMQLREQEGRYSQVCFLLAIFCLSPIPYFFNIFPTFIKADFSLLFVAMLITISIKTIRDMMGQLRNV